MIVLIPKSIVDFINQTVEGKHHLSKEPLEEVNANVLPIIKTLVSGSDVEGIGVCIKREIKGVSTKDSGKDKTVIDKSNLSKEIFKDLISNIDKANEIYLIALKLANNQNLNKIEYIDNFQDEALLLKHFPNFMQEFTANQETGIKGSIDPGRPNGVRR